MSRKNHGITMIGIGAASITGIALAAAFSRGRNKATTAGTERASMGLAPAEEALPRFFSTLCECGTFFETGRGDIILGKGPKSITWRALKQAADLAGFGDASDQIADDTLRRCAYAAMLCAAPYNRDFLTDRVGNNEYRNHEGLGLDLRERPVLWLPMIDLDLLHDCGIVAPSHYEEDGTSTLEIPPELRGHDHG